MEKLMIVEDSEEIRGQLRWGLAKEYEVLIAGDREEALALFKKHAPKVVTLDLGLPPDADGSEEGFRCLEEILRLAPATKVIMITGNEERENALRAVQSGAYDYYGKPIEIGRTEDNPQKGFSPLRHRGGKLAPADPHLREQNFGLGGIIGQSPRMQEVFSSIRKVAASDVAGPGHRRKRHRQGTGRQGNPRPESEKRRTIHRHQLRGHSRKPPGVGTVRCRKGRLHRCACPRPGEGRIRPQGDTVPRRNRRASPQSPGEAPPFPSGKGDPAGRRKRGYRR